MTNFAEIELTEMDDVQLEHLGRSLIPPIELDRRESPSKLIAALEKHVKATDAKVSDDWPGEVPSGTADESLPTEDALKAGQAEDAGEPADLAARTAGLDEQAAEAEKRETALAEREEAVSQREDAAAPSVQDEPRTEEFDPMAELRELEVMSRVPRPQEYYMQPSERKARTAIHEKIQRILAHVDQRR